MSTIDLRRFVAVLPETGLPISEGRLLQVVGGVLEAAGCSASIGDVYQVIDDAGGASIEAEVVGLRGERTLLMPLGETHGLRVGAALRKLGQSAFVRVGRALIGRVVDGLGRPIDGLDGPTLPAERALYGGPRNPLLRRPVDRMFPVGVRVIDGLLSLGEGQRVGIFAGGGVGKSSLLGMMVRRAAADLSVVSLVGERGREVEDFVHGTLGAEGLARAVVVVATSAEPALLRVRAALYAATVADYFRARGRRVLFVMDSLTRYAMAKREIGLAAGEPPATKGYPPSVLSALPQLLERAGNGRGPGSITGIYTVLVEGDDMGDPIADTARAALDGHIVLSRELAERGHFPAVDVPRSVSRVMNAVVSERQLQLAARARETLAIYGEAADLVAVGAYRKGAVPEMDEAIGRMPHLQAFLRQTLDEAVDPAAAVARLASVFAADTEQEG